MNDPETKFAKALGWTTGERITRFAMIIDHGKVVYAKKEPGREVTVCIAANFILVFDADSLLPGLWRSGCPGEALI
jgi:peroxiredoxin